MCFWIYRFVRLLDLQEGQKTVSFPAILYVIASYLYGSANEILASHVASDSSGSCSLHEVPRPPSEAPPWPNTSDMGV